MALGFRKPIESDDQRLQGHETTYGSSRGGWVKTQPKPVPWHAETGMMTA